LRSDLLIRDTRLTAAFDIDAGLGSERKSQTSLMRVRVLCFQPEEDIFGCNHNAPKSALVPFLRVVCIQIR
jgi:hypothetical protein